MRRILVVVSLFLSLCFALPCDGAGSTSGGASTAGDGSISGQIQSVTTTNFSVGVRSGRGRRRRRIHPVLVHFNPASVTITVDGVVVPGIDYKATHKYASVSGTMQNNILEATSITITSSPPASRGRKSKSAS